MFLTESPNGQVRKHPQHLDGHSCPSKRKAPSNRQGIVSLGDITNRLDSLVTEINVNEISDSEWSDSSSDDEI